MEPPVKKSNLEVSSAGEKSDTNDLEAQEKDEIVLTYDVLRMIFLNLGSKDLYTAAKVCRKV